MRQLMLPSLSFLPLAAGAALALFSGCATDDQLGQVRNFAGAATAFSTEANGAFDQLDGSFVERNLSKVATGQRALTDADFVGILEQTRGHQADLKALKAIGAYAAALHELATAGYQKAIDDSSTDLYGALVDLDKNATVLSPGAPQVSDADLALVATAVKAMGEMVADEKRAAALARAVNAADPVLQALCTGLKARIEGSRSAYRKNLDEIFTDGFTSYNREAATMTYHDRMARLAELRAARAALDHADDFLKKLADAAQALAEAHAKIRQSLAEPAFSKAALVRSVGQLRSLVSELKAFDTKLQQPATP